MAEQTKPNGPAFRARIEKLRKDRGWSQREVDRRAEWGDDSGQYSRIERGTRGGKRPTVTMIATLARVFGVTDRFLLWGEQPAAGAEPDSPFQRAAARARDENVHEDAIAGVKSFPEAPLDDEDKLYQLMVFAHHQLMQQMEDKRATQPKPKRHKAAQQEAPASAAPKSKRQTGTE